MKKSAFVLSMTGFLGGGEIFLIKLASLLHDQVRLSVISPAVPSLREALVQADAEFVELGASGGMALRWQFLRWLWRQRSSIREGGVPIILNGRGAAYLAPLVRMSVGVAPIIIAHTELSMRSLDPKEVLYGIAARFASHVITVGEFVATQHKQRWAGLSVESIRNWIVLGSHGTSRRTQNVTDGEILYAAVLSRLAPRKGVEDVIAVCAEDDGIVLSIYGDGPMREQLVGVHGDSTRLHFNGHVANVSECLQKYSILISGSYSESSPLALAEGIYAGLLCVVSDIPAHRELLGESYPDELFFPPGDRAALKRALAAARVRLSSADGDDARTVVAAAMSRLRERNSPELARQRYLAVLCRECGEGRAA